MDKAKATVHETVNPAVQHESVIPTQHVETQAAVDREVHQDHHHTTVQPVLQKEVLPEKHALNVAPTEHREIKHGNDDHIKQSLAAEEAQFKDTREIRATQTSASTASTVAGEHIHHHIHETIQPVIQKETIQPTVVHTVVPVHEVHHREAQHHAASQLPPVTMEQFEAQGGSIVGRDARTDNFSGQPKSSVEAVDAHESTGLTKKDSHHSTETTHKKPSLMDKLNPKIDANGDGKAGFLS